LKKLWRRVEAKVGYSIPNEVRKKLADRFGDDPLESGCDSDFIKFRAHMLEFSKSMLGQGGGTVLPGKPRNATRKGVKHRRCFDERYDVYLFVGIERESKKAYGSLMGEEFTTPSWEELYRRFKAAINRKTGRAYDRIPPTVTAFKQMYQRAKEEFGGLTEEDRSDLTVQMFLDALVSLDDPRRPKTLCDTYRVIRDKRERGDVPKWRGHLTRWDIYGLMETIMDSVVGSRADQLPPGFWRTYAERIGKSFTSADDRAGEPGLNGEETATEEGTGSLDPCKSATRLPGSSSSARGRRCRSRPAANHRTVD